MLQLLLGILHHAISDIDGQLQASYVLFEKDPTTVDFKSLSGRIQRLHTAWASIDRYSSAVKSATVGIEALPGIDPRGAAELNDYVDQVEDVEHRLHERYRWSAEIIQHFATALAQRQSEQISRLTIVSMIFMLITFLTGYFGMNFDWMIERVNNPVAFWAPRRPPADIIRYRHGRLVQTPGARARWSDTRASPSAQHQAKGTA